MKPNVLFISSWYPSKEHETLGNFVQRHAEAINPFVTLEVLYVVSSDRICKAVEIEHQVINQVSTTVVYYQDLKKKGIISKLKKYKNYLKYAWEGFYAIQKRTNINFNILHCNISFKAGLFAVDLQKKRKIPYVLTEHWTLFLLHIDAYQQIGFLTKMAIKKVIKKANLVLPVSNYLGEAMKKRGLLTAFKTVPNVIDSNLFKPTPNNKKETDIVTILHVSSLNNEQKNIEGIFNTLAEITKEQTNFKLTIVSDGNIKKAKELQKKAQLDDKFVSYYSIQSPQQLVKFYQQADFFLLFSNYETFSIVLGEAWSMGLPAIYSQCGGLTEIENPFLGIRVEVKNEFLLKKSILQMMNSYREYDRNEIRSFSVQNFDNQVVGKQFFSIYNQIIKGDY